MADDTVIPNDEKFLEEQASKTSQRKLWVTVFSLVLVVGYAILASYLPNGKEFAPQVNSTVTFLTIAYISGNLGEKLIQAKFPVK